MTVGPLQSPLARLGRAGYTATICEAWPALTKRAASVCRHGVEAAKVGPVRAVYIKKSVWVFGMQVL